MLFKKFKNQMICFFDVLIVTLLHEVLVFQKLGLEENKLIKYYAFEFNTLEEF